MAGLVRRRQREWGNIAAPRRVKKLVRRGSSSCAEDSSAAAAFSHSLENPPTVRSFTHNYDWPPEQTTFTTTLRCQVDCAGLTECAAYAAFCVTAFTTYSFAVHEIIGYHDIHCYLFPLIDSKWALVQNKMRLAATNAERFDISGAV